MNKRKPSYIKPIDTKEMSQNYFKLEIEAERNYYRKIL